MKMRRSRVGLNKMGSINTQNFNLNQEDLPDIHEEKNNVGDGTGRERGNNNLSINPFSPV